MMKWTLRLEELAQLAVGIFALNWQPLEFPWWAWLALFLLPDVGMMGYLVNPRVGAWTYNLFHHKGVALAVWAYGYFFGSDYWVLAGLLLFTHSAFDRLMGYGLKYPDSFRNTHLGLLPGPHKK